MRRRDGVQIDDVKIGVVVVQPHPLPNGAEVVAQLAAPSAAPRTARASGLRRLGRPDAASAAGAIVEDILTAVGPVPVVPVPVPPKRQLRGREGLE